MKTRVTSVRVLRTVLGLVSFGAGAGAGQALAAPAPAPTFEQILQAPDDPELNLAYAQAEANAGRLLTAAAALERVLLTKPGAYAVRLFYAVVLYRLDDLQGARRQLELLAGAPLTPLQAAERDRYLRLLVSGEEPNSFGGHLAQGFEYQGDALGALVAQFDIPGVHPRESGASFVVSGQLNGSVLLAPQSNVSAYGSIAGYSRPDNFGHDNSLESGEGQLGLAGANLTTSWKIGGVLRHYALVRNPYLTESGGQAEASWRPNTAATITGRFEAVRQIYHEPFVDALAAAGTLNGTHDGWRYDAGLSLAYRLSAQSTILATAGYEWKTAGYKPFAYDAPYLQVDFRNLLARGMYLDLMAGMRFYDYRAADTVFLGPGVERQSTRSDVRLVLGVPLSAFTAAGATGDPFEDMTLEAGIGYASRTENAPLGDFDSFGASLRLVWRFGDQPLRGRAN